MSKPTGSRPEEILIWDNHACMPLRPDDDSFLTQLARHRAAGTSVVGLNIGYGNYPIDNHFRMLELFRRWIGQHGDDYLLIKTVEDVRHAKQSGRLGVFFDIEGMRAIGDDLSLVRDYYDLGVRWMLIAYNRNNLVGGGCHDDDGGLTSFGRQVIGEMERLGMVLCCSHTGYRTALEAMEASTNPVILSHSNPKALVDHPRNVPDGVMEACAATGGVMGINGVGLFLGDGDISTENVIRHIDYAVTKIGPDHVGLGLDYVFDMEELDEALEVGQGTFPEDCGYAPGIRFVAPEQLPEIANRLLGLGYGVENTRKIMGENWLRVAGEVWK